MNSPDRARHSSRRTPLPSRILPRLLAGATGVILLLLLLVVGYILYQSAGVLSWRFLTHGVEQDMFDAQKSGILPMIVGTAARVVLMTLFVMPFGIVTAIYLAEFARPHAPITRLVRSAVNNLASVPPIVFGLFGLGFFVHFLGGQLDAWAYPNRTEPVWGKEALLWASLTLATLSLPVVIVGAEDALKSVPASLREGSYALGATRLQTLARVVLPQALPGILTSMILAVSRATGEVAPILMTGAAYYMAALPKSPTDQFMDLAYHIYVLSTQSPNIEQTRPLLYATTVVLLGLTLALNSVALWIRARLRRSIGSPAA